jgi:spore germination cell wall hydrolase CwlJ-like protein
MALTRTVAVIGCSLLALLLVRQEARMTMLEDRLDNMEDIIQTGTRIKYSQKELDCLAKNIYYEAGIEKHPGKIAVGNVTINRLKTGYWGNTICDVVYSKAQFSWTLKKKLPKPNDRVWDESVVAARDVLNGFQVRGVQKSLFYHADYIKVPHWADPIHNVGQIGKHIFYNKAKGSTLEI